MESAAALAQAHCEWGALRLVSIDPHFAYLIGCGKSSQLRNSIKHVVDRAAELAYDHGLRAYDAVHCLPLSSSTMAISSWPAEIKNLLRRAHL